MRSLIQLLSISTALVAGASLLPVVASAFDARELADPLDLLTRVQLNSVTRPEALSP